MQSQGSTSSQPSFDSLSSSDSLPFSDSEQDDADVFLTDGSSSVAAGEAGGAAAGGSESPGSQWTCDGFTDKEEEEESYRSEGKEARGETDPTGQIPRSQGDLLFAQKCAELQGFVGPLLELLNGLKRGRFDRGLSSFQQSVAMDRIQRIVGVLQRPNSGEKYLNTLLQVEMMLKLWFPQIPTQPASAASGVATSPAPSLQDASGSMPPHKHRDQLHIPVKKRRLSWTGTDSTSPSPVLPKCPRIDAQEKSPGQDEGHGPPSSPALPPDASHNSPDVAGDGQLKDDAKGKGSDGDQAENQPKYKAGQSSEPSLTWVHVAPILSPRKVSHEGTTSAAGGDPTPGWKGPATQDSAVTSTTPYKQHKNPNKPIRCQSQPAAGPQGEKNDTRQAQSQTPPHVTLKPSSPVCPTSLET